MSDQSKKSVAHIVGTTRVQQHPDWLVAGLSVRAVDVKMLTTNPDQPIMSTTWSWKRMVADVRARLENSGVELNKRELAAASPTIAFRAANEIGEKDGDDAVLEKIELYTTQYLADKAFQRMSGQLERGPIHEKSWWEAQHRPEDIEKSLQEREKGKTHGDKGKKPEPPRYARLAVASQGMVYAGIDGDDIGGLVEETLRTDDPEAARRVSQQIHEAHKAIRKLVKDRGGKIIFDGGDNMLVYVAFDPDLFEQMRGLYVKNTGHSATMGVGTRPVEAHFALVVGKNEGKDRTVVYDQDVASRAEGIRQEQEALEPAFKKLKYRAESGDVEADEKIKGALWELNMDVTDQKVYDIMMRLVERFGLDKIEAMEQFFGQDRETLKQSIREVYARRLDWSMKVASRSATREERRALVDAMALLVSTARVAAGKSRPLADLLGGHDPHLVAALGGLEKARVRLLAASLDVATAVDGERTPWSPEMSEVEGKAAAATSLAMNLGQDVDVALKACDNAQVEHLGEIPKMPVDTRPVIERANNLTRVLSEAAMLLELAAVAANSDPQVLTAGENLSIDRENRKPGQTHIPSGRDQKSPRRMNRLTIEDQNEDKVDWSKTDLYYVPGNQMPASEQATWGGDPGPAIYTP